MRDLLLQTMATFTDMAGIRLGLGPGGDEARDLGQARQAIETLRALEVAERELGAAQVRPFREPLAALQMAYARVVERPSDRPQDEGGTPPRPEGRLRTTPPAGSGSLLEPGADARQRAVRGSVPARDVLSRG